MIFNRLSKAFKLPIKYSPLFSSVMKTDLLLIPSYGFCTQKKFFNKGTKSQAQSSKPSKGMFLKVEKQHLVDELKEKVAVNPPTQIDKKQEKQPQKKKSSFLSGSKKTSPQVDYTSNANFHRTEPRNTQNDKLQQNQPHHKQSSTHLPTQNPSSHKQGSSYNLRTCEMIIFQFKDIAKQSKSVKQLIQSFFQHRDKLRTHSIEETTLKQKYQSVMYSAVVRTFARILRREQNPDKKPMTEFLGANYENISHLQLSHLTTLQISDFVSFFFLFELVTKYKSSSSTKQSVVQKYLSHLYERYRQGTGMGSVQNEKELVDEQRMQKRYISELLIAARCAQLFQSPLYSLYLSLLSQHISTRQLVPYKIVSIVKFILRPENLSQIDGQVRLLEQILVRMEEKRLIQQFDYSSLREFYGNLVAIVGNNQGLVEVKNGRGMIGKVEGYLCEVMGRLPAQEIYLIVHSALKSATTNYKLARHIYTIIFSNITQKGETSLNPLFIIAILSHGQGNLLFSQLDSQWETKTINMYNRYLQGQKPIHNLSYCSEYIAKLAKNFSSSKLLSTIVDSLTSGKCIVPYDQESFLLESYYVTREDKEMIFASIYRLKNYRSNTDKKKGLYNKIFHLLEAKIDQQVKDKVFSTHKEYIKNVEEIKRNKQGYLRTISKYCQALGNQQLIVDLFHESLMEITQFSFDAQRRYDVNQDPKQKEKINATIQNYLLVLMELKLKCSQGEKDNLNFIENGGQYDKFLIAIKNSSELKSSFLEVLSMRDTGEMIMHNNDKQTIRILMSLLQWMTIGDLQSINQQKIESHQKETLYKNRQNYYYAIYQILKNYPIEALRNVLLTTQVKQAVNKILYSSENKEHSGNVLNQKATEISKSNMTSQSNFIYDCQSDKILLSPQNFKILHKKATICLGKSQKENQNI